MTFQTANLNPILTNDCKISFSYNSIKSKLYATAAAVNLICIIIFSIYLLSFISTVTSSIPIANMLIGVATPVLGVSFTILLQRSNNFSKLANFYKKVSNELKILKEENVSNIKKYLKSINCYYNNINLVIPAIARYRIRAKELKNSLDEISRIKNLQSNDQNFKYNMHLIAHDIYEKEVLQTKLKLAHLYHVIKNPSDTRSLSDFGKSFPLSFSKRRFTLDEKTDYYFVFNDIVQKKRSIKGLTFTQLDNMEIKDISKFIFEN